MKIRPVGAELFHADGRTNMTKLIMAFRNFANAAKIALSTQPDYQPLNRYELPFDVRKLPLAKILNTCVLSRYINKEGSHVSINTKKE